MIEQQQSINQLAITNGDTQGSLVGTNKVSKRNFDSVYDLRDRLNSQKEKYRDQGNDLVTKVYPSDVIPDQYNDRKKDYRPNNFMAGEMSTIGNGSLMRQNNRGSNQRLLRAEWQFLQQAKQNEIGV